MILSLECLRSTRLVVPWSRKKIWLFPIVHLHIHSLWWNMLWNMHPKWCPTNSPTPPPPHFLFDAQFATNNSHLNFINSLSKTSVVLCWQSPSPCYRGLVKRFFLVVLCCLFFEKPVSNKKKKKKRKKNAKVLPYNMYFLFLVRFISSHVTLSFFSKKMSLISCELRECLSREENNQRTLHLRSGWWLLLFRKFHGFVFVFFLSFFGNSK